MQTWMSVALAIFCASACAKKETTSRRQTTSDVTTADKPNGNETDCKMSNSGLLVDAFEASFSPYIALKFPPEDANCEALLEFSIELAPLAQTTKTSLAAISSFSHSLPDACRVQNKEVYGARLQKFLADIEPLLTPRMDRFEAAVRVCADHPGMAEAFEKATFRTR